MKRGRAPAHRVEDTPDAPARAEPKPRDELSSLQRTAGNRAVSKLVGRARGERLPHDVAAAAEETLGASFDGVRLHTGDEGRAVTDAFGARALTVGSDVWLGRGTSPRDRRVLGHELAHVVQQTRPGPAHASGPRHEQQAARTGEALDTNTAAPALTSATLGPQAADGPRPLNELVKDPEVASRLAGIAKAGRDVPGQVLEESMNEQVRAQLATPEGRKTFTGNAPDAEFVEGYRIRGADGKQLSDGMILSGKGKTRVLHAEFEAKLSKDKAGLLHNFEERRASQASKAEKARVQKDPGTGRTIERQSGGQFGQVRERLLEGEKVRIYDRDLKNFEEVEVRPTKDTLWVGAAPKDVPLSATEKAFEQHPLGLKYRSLNVPETSKEIQEAAADVRKQVGAKAPKQPAPKTPVTPVVTPKATVDAEPPPKVAAQTPKTTGPPTQAVASPVKGIEEFLPPVKPPPATQTQSSAKTPEQTEFPFMKDLPKGKPTGAPRSRFEGLKGAARTGAAMGAQVALGFALSWLNAQDVERDVERSLNEREKDIEKQLASSDAAIRAAQQAAGGKTVWANARVDLEYQTDTVFDVTFGAGGSYTFLAGSELVWLEFSEEYNDDVSTTLVGSHMIPAGDSSTERQTINFSFPCPYDASAMTEAEVLQRIAENEKTARKGYPSGVLQGLFAERDDLLARLRELRTPADEAADPLEEIFR